MGDARRLFLAAFAGLTGGLLAPSAAAGPNLSLSPAPTITFGRSLNIQGTPFALSSRSSNAELNLPPTRPRGMPLRAAAISSGFGMRYHPLGLGLKFHGGLDFPAPTGTAVHATAPGRVVFAGWNGGYGMCLILEHGGGMTTLFGHLSAVAVKPGEPIAQGQVIGVVGSTGRSTGPHLHYEVRLGSQALDPRRFL